MDWELLYRNVDEMNITQHEWCEYRKLISDIREQISSYLNSDMFGEDDRYLTYIINHIEDTSLTEPKEPKLPSGLVLERVLNNIPCYLMSKILSREDFFKLRFLYTKYANVKSKITFKNNQYRPSPSGWGWEWGAFFGIACIASLVIVIVLASL